VLNSTVFLLLALGVYAQWNPSNPITGVEQQRDGAEKPADPLELRIYRGVNGSFTLYEDDNDTYDYEKGVYSTIPMHWDEAAHTLTIGERKGSFPGIQETRALRIVFVGEGYGSGIGLTVEADKIVQYSSKHITITP
jgi:alpha-D-xyloside xylohydrolase